MTLNVGINGFGRIGRIIFRTCFQNPDLKVSAINDPAVDIDYICYLIKFDSTHGKFRNIMNKSENEITIDGHKIAIFKEKLPTDIPWQQADVQYVVEASGMFTNLEKASGHLASEGVKRVLVTTPSLDVPMLVLGVNDDKLSTGHKVISCASSTLYCLAPIIKVLEDQFGVSEGFITSIHAMTPSLKPLDGLCLKGKHWRDHRSIHQNIIPATTGACRALGKIIPQVKDKMSGLAFRVPIVNVSVLDITIRLKSDTSIEDIVRQVENAGNFNMKNIIKLSNDQAVSSDFIGDTFSCVLDVDSSLQLTPNFFKLICWYENEYSYACRIIDSIFFLERQYQFEWKSKMSYIRPTPNESSDRPRECNKFTYHQNCSYEYHSNFKSLSSTSQDSGFKSPKRSSGTKKYVSPRNVGARQINARDLKKKNELFKIWNDEDGSVKPTLRHNPSSFFHSCIAIAPQLNNNHVKTRERLENVKRDFSKMVIMTENLLKQSQHSKIKIGSTEISRTNMGDANIEKVIDSNEVKSSLDKCSHIEKQSNYDSSKHIKEGNNTNKILDEEMKNILNIERELFNNMNNNKLSNGLVNNDDKSYSKEPSKIIFDCRQTLKPIGDRKNKKTIIDTNPDELNKNANNFKIKENIATADNKSVAQVSNCAFKIKNDWQNHTVPILGTHNKTNDFVVENDKIPHKSWMQQQNPRVTVTKQNESCCLTSVTFNNKNTSEIIDANKREEEKIDSQDKPERSLQMRLDDILKKLSISNIVFDKSTSPSSINTITTASNRDIKRKQDIYDKLDSVSATDSENSFHMKERKSQVINITDLTNSLEDLDRLDKICRIMEISDELSDKLLSALNTNDCKELNNKKWSFKDLCERIRLDEFCNKMFSKSSS